MPETEYTGINYAGGAIVNQDATTGIRYGVIPSGGISGEALNDIYDKGTDADYRDYIDNVKSSLRAALKDYFSDTKWSGDKTSKLDEAVENAFDGISDSVGDNYGGTGDCARYEYERDGYKLLIDGQADMWIVESPYFTYAQFCSPCAPGACYLNNPLKEAVPANKCYCLGHEWFDSERPCPYPVYAVATGALVKNEN